MTSTDRLIRTGFIAGFAALALAACDRQPEALELEGSAFGTRYQVILVDPGGDPGLETGPLAGAIEDTLESLDRTFSTWRADSEISRINRAEAGIDLLLSDDFQQVLAEARSVHRLSGGALDVALLPLAEAWGFQALSVTTPPSDEALARLKRITGMQRLAFGEDGSSLRKRDARQGLDLSALAKGYAVDRLGDLLREAGANDFLVAFGGEILARGERPGGGPWRIAIEPPAEGLPSIPLLLSDAAVATSGDYRNFVEIDGDRLGHVLDPATGRPSVNGAVSATVIAASTQRADALATAFLVLDEASAFELAATLGVGLRRVVRHGDGFASRENAAFRAHVATP
ncbi:MAG: FAD:protein FMN transferase [Xanthomonadales bacterium]|nr:FAD:protein FMN transferase [Xanthomonadales bacterium]